MSGSASQARNDTSSATTVNTKNLAVTGNSGLSIVGGDNGLTSFVDKSVSQNTTNTTTNIISADADVASAAITGNASLALSALSSNANLATSALNTSQHVTDSSLSFAAGETAKTQDVLVALGSQFVGALTTFETNQQSQLGNTVSALNQIAKDQNQSANQLVVQASSDAQAQASKTVTDVLKYIGYSVAAGVIVWMITKSNK